METYKKYLMERKTAKYVNEINEANDASMLHRSRLSAAWRDFEKDLDLKSLQKAFLSDKRKDFDKKIKKILSLVQNFEKTGKAMIHKLAEDKRNI